MRKRWVKAVLAVFAALWFGVAAVPLIASSAHAQSTGGSFGGGSFGGGGGGGGGSFGGGGGSYGGGGYSGSYSGGGYSGGGGSFTSQVCSMIFFFGIAIAFHYARRQGFSGGVPSLGSGGSHGQRSWNRVDVSAIRIGIDWRARPTLQAELERLAKSGNTGSPEGLARLLRETILALRRCELSWLYCNIANYHPMSGPMAEGIFRQLGVDSRSRFTRELVRNADGTTSTMEAGPLSVKAHEGEGVVVVTLIVASRREIVDVTDIHDANRIKTLLDDLTASANPLSLVAMEVIWSPAAEDDRMSTAELEANYPQLSKIDERSIAGRVFCGYCRGPFAMELLNCPHCGAPAPRE